MNKIIFSLITMLAISANSFAYQVISTKEFGKGDAKNQNIIVQCTTDTGKQSSEQCFLRRYVKCNDQDKKNCNSWYPWRDMRDNSATYPDWKKAAIDCCKKKGLR